VQGDLGFKAGDELKILNQEGEWWDAEKDGKRGIVPANYVDLK